MSVIRHLHTLPLKARLLAGWYLLSAIVFGVALERAIALPVAVIYGGLLAWLIYGLLTKAYVAWLITWMFQAAAVFTLATAFVILLVTLTPNVPNLMTLLAVVLVWGINYYFLNYIGSPAARRLYHAPPPRHYSTR